MELGRLGRAWQLRLLGLQTEQLGTHAFLLVRVGRLECDCIWVCLNHNRPTKELNPAYHFNVPTFHIFEKEKDLCITLNRPMNESG